MNNRRWLPRAEKAFPLQSGLNKKYAGPYREQFFPAEEAWETAWMDTMGRKGGKEQ